jgi:predicted nicotinamide N-methyase
VVAVQALTATAGGRTYRLRALRDRLEESDPMFGELWPAGAALAEVMATFPAAGKRVLEAGCGLALPSLVLKSRGIDVTATDHNALAGEFLAANVAQNGLPPIPFLPADWSAAELGKWDLVIAADVLYEPDHPAQLAAFLDRHTAPGGAIVIADPNRRPLGAFKKLMHEAGFQFTEEKTPSGMRLLTFARLRAG